MAHITAPAPAIATASAGNAPGKSPAKNSGNNLGTAALAERLRGVLDRLTTRAAAQPVDGIKAHQANLRREAARRAADALLR